MYKTITSYSDTILNGKHHRKLDEWFWGYMFIAPILIGMLIFFIGPILFSFYMSLTEWSTLTEPVFHGIKNYVHMLKDQKVFREIINTFYYALGTVPISIFLSIVLAVGVNRKISGKSVYRMIYFLPSITMPTAVALVWQWLFNSKLGLINIALGWLHLPTPMWLGNPRLIMPAIIIVSIWKVLGYNMVIVLAGLQNIPKSLYEAADIDGASQWYAFWRITIPMLTPTIFFLLSISLINAFKAFDIIYVFAIAANATQGPILDATRTMVYGIYEKGFTLLQMGYASAEAVVLFIFILIITVVQFAVQDKWVHY